MNMHGSFVGMTTCFLCGEADQILIHERLAKVFPAHGKVGCVSLEPCQKCQDFMRQGVVLISYDEAKTDMSKTIELPNPAKTRSNDGRPDTIDTKMPNFHRTGGWCVVRDEAIKRMPLPEEHVTRALKQRVLFIPDQVWDSWGLPREDYNPADPIKDKVTMHYSDCRYAKDGNTTRVPERVTCKLCLKKAAAAVEVK